MDRREFGNAREAVEYLKRRIRDQADLERRQKLENDRQLIRNRRQSEIITPVAPGHDQEMWFAKLESNGIWEMVFEFITSPSDMTSAYLTCEMFRKHLEKKRKFTLLPKVFGVLRENEYLSYIHDILGRAKDDDELEDRKLQKQDVLNQRLVSKAWKRVAEEEFIENPLDFNTEFGWMSEIGLLREFEQAEEVDSAIEALGSSKICSSLIRTVKVDDNECGDKQGKDNFYSKLVQFLDTHGDSVWGLAFYFNLDDDDHDSNYENLWNVVSRMPNLKTLEFSSWLRDDDFEDAEARILQLMAKKRFPTIPSLERCIFGCPTECDAIIVEILSTNVNVKSIVLKWNDDMGPGIPDYVWNAMRNLRLEKFELFFEGESNGFLHAFSQVEQCNWPLKSLHLFYISRNEQVNIGASRVLAFLSRFNDTLEDVNIDHYGYGSIPVQLVNDNGGVVVHFPNLKKLILPRFRI